MPDRKGKRDDRKKRFNEAAGADPADARRRCRGSAPQRRRFNEAAGADPADARSRFPETGGDVCFNEAAGADPADATASSHDDTEADTPSLQ